MKSRIEFYLSLILFTLAFSICSKGQNINKLNKQLKEAKHDTTRVNLLYSISTYYWNVNNDSVLHYAELCHLLAKKIHYKKGITNALLAKGVAYDKIGQYSKSLEYYIQVLKISEEEKKPALTASCYTNIGIVYFSLMDYDKAMDYLQRASGIYKKIDKEENLVSLFINLGDIHLRLNHFDSSVYYNSKALTISTTKKDSLSIAVALYNLGDTYLKANELVRADEYFKKSLVISRKINDLEGIALCFTSLAKIKFNEQHFDQSILLADSARKRARELNGREMLIDIYSLFYKNYSAKGDFRKAIDFRNREISLRDSLVNSDTKKQIENIQSLYQLEKKQSQLNLQEKEIAYSKNLQWIYAGSLVLFSMLILYLLWLGYKRRRLNISLVERNGFIHNLNEEINKQNQKLTKLNLVKDKLMSIISHDIRSPLNNLKGLMDLLHGESLSQSEFKMLGQKLSEQLTITNTFVENLLFWAKSQMEGERIMPETVDLAKLSKNIIDLLKTASEEKHICIINSIPLGEKIYADKSMLEITLRNLLTNAIKFSKPGGQIYLSVQEEKETNQMEVSVRDTGVGMTEEQCSSLFETTVPSTQGTANERGIGLGLLLCKELIEKNGGSIGVVSKPDEGSNFTFSIPRAKYFPETAI